MTNCDNKEVIVCGLYLFNAGRGEPLLALLQGHIPFRLHEGHELPIRLADVRGGAGRNGGSAARVPAAAQYRALRNQGNR